MDMVRFGNSKVSYCNAPNPIELTTKEGEKLNLLELCQQATPPCRLNPFLFNGHLQTFWTAVRSFDIPIFYKRRIFEAEESTFAGTFAVDFAVAPFDETHDSLPPRTAYYTDSELNELGSPDSKPMLVALHGLSGGSHEIYLRSVFWLIRKEGWNACVVNARGCAKSSLTSGVLYNARATWDVRQVVKWLRNTFPNRPLFGIGFSLGANILVNVRTIEQLFSNMQLRKPNEQFFTTVSWRRRCELFIESRCGMFKSVEPRSWLVGASEVMGRARSVFENNGRQYEGLV